MMKGESTDVFFSNGVWFELFDWIITTILSTMCFRPKAGSMTEMRGRKAFTHISREIIELCECIYDVGMHQKEPDDDSGEIIVTFGELFAVSISSYYGDPIESRIWLSCWGTTRK